MNESDFFDNDAGNDKRYLTGAVIGYQPKFIPGLNLGINRVLYRDWFDGDFVPLDLVASVIGRVSDDRSGSTNDEYDQMFSLMVNLLLRLTILSFLQVPLARN